MAFLRFHFRAVRSASAFVLLLWFVTNVAEGEENPAKRAETNFVSARAVFNTDRDNLEAAWKFGRACFDWADFAENDAHREAIAKLGIEACRMAARGEPKMVQGHYYLAMNLGQLARTKKIGALKLVDEMEEKFRKALELDPQFDSAGPDRNLGLLYLEAPRWPASVGNRSKARQHLERAVKISPDYPENRLNLIEAYMKWSDFSQARRNLESLNVLWPSAKKALSGELWDSSWVDWQKRKTRIEKELSKH